MEKGDQDKMNDTDDVGALIILVLVIVFLFSFIVFLIDISSTPTTLKLEYTNTNKFAGETSKYYDYYTITINRLEYECGSNDTAVVEYNKLKEKYILSHEFLHYFNYHSAKSERTTIYETSFSKLVPLNRLKYIDQSINPNIIEEYQDYFKGEEYYVRVVNYCYYARNTNTTITACSLHDFTQEFNALDTLFRMEQVKQFMNGICTGDSTFTFEYLMS